MMGIMTTAAGIEHLPCARLLSSVIHIKMNCLHPHTIHEVGATAGPVLQVKGVCSVTTASDRARV